MKTLTRLLLLIPLVVVAVLGILFFGSMILTIVDHKKTDENRILMEKLELIHKDIENLKARAILLGETGEKPETFNGIPIHRTGPAQAVIPECVFSKEEWESQLKGLEKGVIETIR